MAASDFCQRLIDQLVLQQRRDAELLQESRRMAQLAAEKQTLSDRDAAVAAEKEKLTALRQKLMAQHAALEASLRSETEEDERLRKSLSDELSVKIAEVNARMEKETNEREDAIREKARNKEKIDVLRENLGTGGDKFVELMKSGEVEGTALEKRLIDEKALDELLTKKAQELDEQIRVASIEHNELKVKVDFFVQRFTEVQKTLADANAHFAKSKKDQERLMKRFTAADAERAETSRRLLRELNQLAAEKEALERREHTAKTLEAQVVKLEELYNMLRS